MNDLATLTAQPGTINIQGKEYKLHPLTFADLGELQTWVDRQFPDPFDVVSKAIKSGEFNFAQQQFMLDKAIEKATRARRLIGTPEADELLLSSEGYKRVITISIRKGDPTFTDEASDELFKNMTQADLAKLAQATTLDMVTSDPKEEELIVMPPLRKSGSAMSRREKRAAKRRRTGGKYSTGR